jgi:hypothetical protein
MATEVTRGRGHRPSPQEKAKVLAVVKKEIAAGMSVLAISKKYNYNYQTLLRWLDAEKKPGTGNRRRGRPPGTRSTATVRRKTKTSGSATVEINLQQLVADNRAAVIAALTDGMKGGALKAILNLLES